MKMVITLTNIRGWSNYALLYQRRVSTFATLGICHYSLSYSAYYHLHLHTWVLYWIFCVRQNIYGLHMVSVVYPPLILSSGKVKTTGKAQFGSR